MAFPTLFPYGRADLRDQSHREVEVNTAEYFNALLRYKPKPMTMSTLPLHFSRNSQAFTAPLPPPASPSEFPLKKFKEWLGLKRKV